MAVIATQTIHREDISHPPKAPEWLQLPCEGGGLPTFLDLYIYIKICHQNDLDNQTLRIFTGKATYRPLLCTIHKG